MVDINEVYKSNSNNLNAEEIGNEMWTVTIVTADVQTFKEGDSKIVLTFREVEKGLPLNMTNARSIAAMYGHNSNDWIGKQIMLFSMPVEYQGKQTLGIRVRAPAPPQQPVQAQAPAGQQYDERNPPPADPADYRV